MKNVTFLATVLEGEANPEGDENIETVKIKIEELVNMVNRGEINDSKTIIGIFYAEKYINKKNNDLDYNI